MGRLGIDQYKDFGPVQTTVLRNLLDWRDEFPDRAYANLLDWTNLDLQRMAERYQKNRRSKPRIELTAELTKKDNLTVRWYPAGFTYGPPAWPREREHFNLINTREYDDPPDFRWFEGDEAATWTARATNELMFIREVGHLSPSRENHGFRFNKEVVDSILLCALRGAFNGLVASLRQSFEVELLNDFAFDVEPLDPSDTTPLADNRVVGWRIVDLPPKRTAEVVGFPKDRN
jgi:hypothetical protein